MKKFVLILSFSLAFALCTACGKIQKPAEPVSSESSVSTKPEAPRPAFAGEKKADGVYEADYVWMYDDCRIQDAILLNDTILAILVTNGMEDDYVFYNSKTGEMTDNILSDFSESQQAKITAMKPHTVSTVLEASDYLENPYLGEQICYENGDYTVTYNDILSTLDDHILRIYKNDTLVFRESLFDQSTHVFASTSPDKNCLLVGNQTDSKTTLYLIDTSCYQTALETNDAYAANTKQVLADMKEFMHVSIKVPTKKMLKKKKVDADLYKEDVTVPVALLYTALSKFPESFWEEFYNNSMDHPYDGLIIYLTGEIHSSSDTKASEPAMFFTDETKKRQYIVLDVSSLNGSSLLTTTARELMHCIDCVLPVEDSITDPASEDTTFDRADLFAALYEPAEKPKLLQNPSALEQAQTLNALLRSTFPSLNQDTVWYWERFTLNETD